MTPYQIKLIQDSFTLVLPMADEAAALFYGRLFELDPTLRPLFTTDINLQGRKLMSTLAVVVADLEKPESLVGAVRRLGRRHAEYGVELHHYDTVGRALLWALSQGIGDAFTAEVEEAWAAAYRFLSEQMQDAAVTILA